MNTTFRIYCESAKKAAALVYGFMTGMDLFQPECDFLKNNRTCILEEREVASMTKADFAKEIVGSGIVSCSGYTDIECEKRVSLTLLQNMSLVLVSFPYSYSGMTPKMKNFLLDLKYIMEQPS